MNNYQRALDEIGHNSHDAQGRSPNLEWKVGLDAVRETLRQRRHDQG